MVVTISAKGQMVIPSVLRRRYGLGARSRVCVLDKGNSIALIPLPADPVRASRGILRGLSTRRLLQTRRAERKREQRG